MSATGSLAEGVRAAARHWPRGLALFSRLILHPDDTGAATDGTIHLNAPWLPGIAARFRRHPEGTALLRDRPLLDRRGVDFAALAALPSGTLGRTLVEFFDHGGYDPDAYRDLPPGFSGDEAYVGLRLRQAHDVWHVVTDIAPDLCGEIELQAFTFGQLRTPSSALLGFVGGLRWWPKHAELMSRVWRAYRRGTHAEWLAPLYWERRFATPLAEIRAELALISGQ